MKAIPFLRPNLVRKETYEEYLSNIDDSRWYSNFGPLNTHFEKRVLEGWFHDVGAVCTVNNATSGLILALSANHRSKGRYALMPSFTFSATPLAAIWCGLTPYFIDVRADDWCMDENVLSKTIKELKDDIAVVIPYATFGTYMDYTYYSKLEDSGIPVVIDAAASFGTTEKGVQFGEGFSGIVVFSFHATKAFGIGEGGLVYSRKKGLIEEVRQSSNFGFSDNRETVSLGLNAKMPEYEAAIALATLDAFPQKIERRQQITEWYIQEFNDRKLFQKGWVIQKTRGKIPSQFFSTLCPEDQTNSIYINQLLMDAIEARTYFNPACHNQIYFQSYPSTGQPVTEDLSQRILNLPFSEDMNKSDVIRVVNAIYSKGA